MATARALRLFASRPWPVRCSLHRRLLSAGGAGDPALHSGSAPSEEYTRFAAADKTGGKHQQQPALSSDPTTTRDRVPPFGSSRSNNKLGSQQLADPSSGSSFTQKRRLSSSAREEATPGREEAAPRKVREEDQEYYRTHKPSPLAELQFADTRKPLTRATDADRLLAAEVKGDTVQDTADDSLARAEAMFREAASRGNPYWPHSRALAEMLARRRNQQAQGNDDERRSS